MKEYQVIIGNDAADLKLLVEKEMAGNWQPLGGVSVTTVVHQQSGTPVTMLLQAMGK